MSQQDKRNRMNRRQFLQSGLLAGAGLFVSAGPKGVTLWQRNGEGKLTAVKQIAPQIAGGTLPPGDVPKFAEPLVKPPVLPRDGKVKNKMGKNADYYEIAMRQFKQYILPQQWSIDNGKGPTTVWSYGPAADPRTVFEGGRYFYPAFTIENMWNKPTTVKWINDLGGKQHLLPVDPTLHWANPIGRRDTRPNPTDDPDYFSNAYIGADGRYTGPVPMVVHVHGAHVTEESDGYPEAWWLPAGATGVNYTEGRFTEWYKANRGLEAGDGYAVFTYPNDQPATTLWYHDHTLGMTRLNVYAGPAGFWLIRSGPGDTVLDSRDLSQAILPGPAPKVKIDPFGNYYEIPIVIQDRSFNGDGTLFYPDNRAFFEGLDPNDLQIPFTFDSDSHDWGYGCGGALSDVAPIWQPEFFGNMMVVNGRTWPYLNVEQRRYRFRFLNGCNSRFLILKMTTTPRQDNESANTSEYSFWQIGAEQGFLPASVELDHLLMGPAERADVIVDFTNVPVGTEIYLVNDAPDEPFGGGDAPGDFDAADAGTTGQVMKFVVVGPPITPDLTTPPDYLQLPAQPTLPAPTVTRHLSLNEEESASVLVLEGEDGWVTPVVPACDNPEAVPFGPTAALLGTLNLDGTGNPLLWADPITENPAVGATEEWQIHNLTVDAHPIHVHLIKFKVLGRGVDGMQPPEAWETGYKDTVIAYPGEITRVQMQFDLPGFYVWHCHIVEHEDNEMMRPYHVGPIPPDAPAG